MLSAASFKISIKLGSAEEKASSFSDSVTSSLLSSAPSNFLLYSKSALSPFFLTLSIISETILETSEVGFMRAKISLFGTSPYIYILIIGDYLLLNFFNYIFYPYGFKLKARLVAD